MPPSRLFHLHDDGGVRQAQQFGQNHAGLAVAEIVGLQAGEDQVGASPFTAAASSCAAASGSSARHVFLDVDGAVGAFGEGFANGRGGARRTGAEGDHFAAVLFLELQACFQGVGVRLVDLVGEIGLLRSTSPEDAMRNCESRAGTCLMATMIFMSCYLALWRQAILTASRL